MSYGRDKNHLDSMPSYRASTREVSSRPKTQATGWNPGLLFQNRYKPSVVQPDTVRLIRGKYTLRYVPLDENRAPVEIEANGRPRVVETVQPMYKAREHYYARTKRTAICCGGALVDFRKWRDPCLGCDEFWAGYQNGKRGGAMSMSDKYIVTALHYALYHEMPQIDANTKQPRLNQQTGLPWMEWRPCNKIYDLPCMGCKEGAKSKEGHVGQWPMGFGHWNVLLRNQEAIGRSCVSCGGEKCIRSLAWICPREGCGAAVIDWAAEPDLTAEEVEKLTTSAVRCPGCGYRVYLQEEIECGNCSHTPNRVPVRATLFDVDLNVMRIKQSTADNKETTALQISRFSDPCTIPPGYSEIAQPMNLERIYTPTPNEMQAQLFNLPLPGEKKDDAMAMVRSSAKTTSSPEEGVDDLPFEPAARPYKSMYRP